MDQISQVRSNPGIPYEVAKDKSLDEIRQSMSQTRAALISAIQAASDSAFTEQPDNADGEEVWSVGPIVAHCNSSLLNIGKAAIDLIGIDLGEPPASLVAASESKVMSRQEALAAAQVVELDDFFAAIPDDESLDNTAEHDFFGTMNARSWLHFMAMHEAEHVAQIKSLG